MELDRLEEEKEYGRLERVLNVIRLQLDKSRGALDLFRKEVIKTQKSMWDEVNPTPSDLDDLANVWQYQVDIEREGRKALFEGQQAARLEKMLSSPYFGRIDFREDGESTEDRIYIGLSNLSDEKTSEYLVFDWRAPISAMFYDFETGRASYKCPAGIIEGDLVLKRQYRIWKSKLEYMFDSSLKIDDEILQEILSRSADSKMRTIVTSIQREQNKAIRDDTNRLLIVQGAAGSGKTSIALHRAAYLLYRYKDTVKADNIVIFSPNQIFSDYISNVLPELGEENMRRTTFMQYARSVLGKALELEDMNLQMEFILSRQGNSCCTESAARIDGIRYKATAAFAELLKRYAKYMEDTRTFRDIEYRGEMIEPAAEIDSYFRRDMATLPVSMRLEKIRNRLYQLIDAPMRSRVEEVMQELADTGEYVDKSEMKARSALIVREEMRPVREKIESMTAFNLLESYISLFSEKGLIDRLSEGSAPSDAEGISEYTIKALKSGRINYEDLGPVLFLKGMLEGYRSRGDIRHVIIDEVQDYTAVQFEVFRQLFPHCSITMLGDISQSINPYMNIGSYETVTTVMGTQKSALINLSKSYRSTRQITEFCRALLLLPDESDYVNRDGELPKVIVLSEEGNEAESAVDKLYSTVINGVTGLSATGCESIAVICRTEADCNAMYERIKGETGARLMSRSDEEFSVGTLVIPSYLAKGLEFDGVIVCDASDGGYDREEERRLLYTACTRALHNLYLICKKKPSRFIANLKAELYERIEK